MHSRRSKGIRIAALGLVLSAAACGQILGLEEFGFGELCHGLWDCDGDDGNPCTYDTCNVDGSCLSEPAPDGPAAVQVAGDCLTLTCVAGQLVEEPSGTDVLSDDNDCTSDNCVDGQPLHTFKPDGEVCFVGQAGGQCANGTCGVACGTGLDACDDGNDCTEDACDAATGTCAFTPRHGVPPIGHVEEAGNCTLTLCVNGQSTAVLDDADLPAPVNDCHDGVCNGGMPMQVPLAQGTGCGGGVCDGGGACVECNAATDCAGQDTECRTRTCVANACGVIYTGAGTPVSQQAAGDCQVVVCDGNGNQVSQADNTDFIDDNNECTTEACVGGVLTTVNVPVNTACGPGGVLYCNGAGACVGCTTASQCPQGTFCGIATCTNQQCGYSYTAAGTPLPPADQVTGDCKVRQCTGSSLNSVEVAHGTDTPPDDGNHCTSQTCNGSNPAFPPVAINTACSQNGGSYCNATGTCVQCNQASQCTPGGNACIVATCNANICGFMNVSSGTPQPDPTLGDCQRPECDGNGGIVVMPYGLDVPVDNNQCTNDVCTGATPSNPAVPDGTACNQNNGQVCEAGQCLRANGQTCASPGQCASGNCADGRCCNTACSGDCVSCNNAQGMCTNLASGTQDTCPAGSVCNGTGACREVNGETCAAPGECLSGNCVDGVCCNTGCNNACYACNMSGSMGTCSVNAALAGTQDTCAANEVCDAGVCTALLANGQACLAAAECLSGACVDGVCCNTGCNDPCQACNVAGSEGTCAPDPSLDGMQDTCPAGQTCDTAGVCN